jgi:hypothetical protein
MCHFIPGPVTPAQSGKNIGALAIIGATGLGIYEVHRALHAFTAVPVAAPVPAAAPGLAGQLTPGFILAAVVVFVLVVAAVVVRRNRTAAHPGLVKTKVSARPAAAPTPVPAAEAAEAVEVEHDGATVTITPDGVEKREGVLL